MFKIILLLFLLTSCKQNTGKKKEKDPVSGSEITTVQRPMTPSPTSADKIPFTILLLDNGNLNGSLELRLDYMGAPAAGSSTLPSCRNPLSKDEVVGYVACGEGSNSVETLTAGHTRQVCRANSNQKPVEVQSIFNLKNCKKATVSPIQLSPDVALNYTAGGSSSGR